MTSSLLASAGDVGWSAKVNNAISSPQLNGFRLTLTSVTPVTTSDVTGATTIYVSPYTGNRISLYDGTYWQAYASAEVSLALGTLSSGVNYDVFVYDNNGALTIDTLVAWTNNTTRATSLVRTDGVWLKSGALTRRYVGTIRTTATTTTEDSGAKRFVFNADNRVLRRTMRIDSTTTWTTTSTSFVAMNSGASAWKCEFVVGLNETHVRADLHMFSTNPGGANQFSFGLDSTSAPATNTSQVWTGNNFTLAGFSDYLGLGYHYLNGIHRVSAGTGTYYGNDTGNLIKSGIFAECWA